jgi:Swiss Army Knife RNA repair-like protein
MPSSVVILFLDFDGVLHPAGCHMDRHFCELPRFEALMREYPDVRIVISSSWQRSFPLPALRALFSADIAARIIGRTLTADPDGDAKSRHQQIWFYLGRAGATSARWIALDDAERQFPRKCPQLVLCDPVRGFDELAAEQLIARLASLKVPRHEVKPQAA